jgi:hypothetical protein
MGGVVASKEGADEASEFDTPKSFIKTASRDGAATSGNVEEELRRRARNECSRVNNSDEGTGDTVAKDECIPFGGRTVVCDVTPHRVIAAPSRAPASSTDRGTSSVLSIVA